jgi:hypothetical protein
MWFDAVLLHKIADRSAVKWDSRLLE